MTQEHVRPGQQLERDQLSLLEVIMSGLIQIAPAVTLILVLTLMAGFAGESVPLVMLLGALGAAATGNALAQFSRVWPSSGSFVTFISRAIHPRVGLAVAVATLVGYIITWAGIYLFVGQFILTEVFKVDLTTGGNIITSIVYGLVILVPVIVGLTVSIRLAIALYALEVAVILAISIAVLIQGGDHGLTAHPFTLGTGGVHGVASALALGVLAYVGFEAPAPLAEETRNPRRNVPLALMVGILATAALIVFASYAAIVAFPSADAFAKSAVPFKDAADRFISPLASVITALFLTSVSASFMIANTETSRVIFNGAREGLWARALANVHPRFKTPWLAAIAFVLPSLVIAAIAPIFWDVQTASGFLSSWGTLGIILMYAMTNIALVVLWFRERAAGVTRHVMTWLVIPIVGIAILGIPYWSSFQAGQSPPFNRMWLYFLALILIGVAYAVVLSVRRPDLADNAGSIVMGEVTPDRLPDAAAEGEAPVGARV